MAEFPNKASQFKPGKSGNPGGRPRGQSVTAKLREALDAKQLGGKKLPRGTTISDLLKDVVLKGALKGDFRFIQFLVERTEHYDELVSRVEALEAALDPAATQQPARRTRKDAGGPVGGA